jgi:sulfate permease, SulP family
MLKKFVPAVEWLSSYNKENLSGDLTAGITVGVMLIPQGMAYSMLAGLPPIYGLYASTIPLIIYALLGTSRQLAVGPVALVSLLILNGVGQIANPGSEEFVAIAIMLTLLVGIVQFAMGMFKLGFLVNFLSHPVISGFTSAAAIIIGLSQLKHLLGYNINGSLFFDTIVDAIMNIDKINIFTFAIGIASIVVLIILKKVNKKIPGGIIVLLLSIAAVYFGGLTHEGVKILGDIPAGLPAFGVPMLDWRVASELVPVFLTISFIGFMESIAVAKAIQAKHRDYKIDSNQELIALGTSNVVGSFFSSFPVTGGFSRTAVNNDAGAKTALSSIISAVLILLTLMFFTSYFYYLPNAVLAAIIMVAVFGLIDVKEAKHLWAHDKKDFLVFMITALITLVLGIEDGILAGVIISLGILIYNVSYPHIAELGRVSGSNEFRNIKRFDKLETFDDMLILRFDAQLFFANAGSLRDYIEKRVFENPKIKHVIIESSSVIQIDSSAIQVLLDLNNDLKNGGIELYMSNVKGPVRDALKRHGLFNEESGKYYFITTDHAVNCIRERIPNTYSDYVLQAGKTKID